MDVFDDRCHGAGEHLGDLRYVRSAGGPWPLEQVKSIDGWISGRVEVDERAGIERMSAQVAGQYRYASASDCSFSQGSQIRNGQCGFAFESRSEDVPPVSAQQWDIMGVREQRKLLERVRDAGHRWGIPGDKILRGLGHFSSCYEDERLVHERTCKNPAPPRSLRCDDEIERPRQQCVDEPVGDTWRDLYDKPSRYQRCNGGGNDFRKQFSRSAEPHGSFQRRTATGAFQCGGKSLEGAGET
jgi:hypothetical protein